MKIAIAGALVLAQILPVHARAAEPEADHAVAVEIDTSTLSSFAEGTAERLSLEVDEALEAAGMRRAEEGRGRLRIEVTFGASKVDLAYRVTCTADGRDVAAAQQEGGCERCVTDQIVGEIDDGLPKVLAALAGALESETAGSAAAGKAVPPPAITPPSSPDDDERAPRIRPIGKAGIAVGAVGLVGTGVGIWLAVRTTEFESEGDGEREQGIDTRAGGIAMAAVGGAAIVAGLTMLLLGVGEQRRRRPAAVSMIPTRGGAAVGFGMRF